MTMKKQLQLLIQAINPLLFMIVPYINLKCCRYKPFWFAKAKPSLYFVPECNKQCMLCRHCNKLSEQSPSQQLPLQFLEYNAVLYPVPASLVPSITILMHWCASITDD